MNPYTQMRADANRTQQYLADISDVNEQFIRRLEYGLLNSGNRRVSRELLDILPSDYWKEISQYLYQLDEDSLLYTYTPHKPPTVDQQIDMVELWYKAWQRQTRAEAGQRLKEKGFVQPPNWRVTPIDFRLTVMSVLLEDGTEESFAELAAKCSVYEYCVTFSMHPFSVQRWEAPPSTKKVARTTAPPTVAFALSQAGFDLSQITFVR